ncbi:capsule assembly Wzi family protein [Oryzomonas japonica]|uniref:Capsule assembly Wzi family protein n=2 Tax=Oryzomonas japonica TaxID=2603858 RepID=A0A7J4ZQU7_9BACT|nr:capsule assembly Wzi family protein [Oryzomonas japonica]
MLSATAMFLLVQLPATTCLAVSSANIPLDSPIYLYLEKLAGFGLITSDVKGLKPFSKAEAARQMLEAETNLESGGTGVPAFARELIDRTRELLPREVSLQKAPERKPQFLDLNPIASLRMRYLHLNGAPRNYVRPVHDPGDDGVFGIGSGLRPATPGLNIQQVGSEGTPLAENNDGAVYHQGSNAELRWAAEGYVSDKMTGLLEPMVLTSEAGTAIRLNRGYFKVGGGALELELGKDENWLGLGYRGNITLTNNAENLTIAKLSSPEPFRAGWLSWLGDLKYALILSRLDKTVTDGQERRPWFYAIKLSSKPTDNLEIGLNLGRMQGGPGVNNSIRDWVNGLVGGTSADNSKANAGFEARYRIPWLRNTELYGEFSGCDAASVWPIVESYVAGFFIPRLTAEGRDDFRFEFFQGNQILYTSGTFPAGFLYKGLPLGDSQGGATQDFFSRYSHWFSTRNNLALEYIYTNRGMIGRVQGQAIERKHAGRAFWTLPVYGDVDAQVEYGVEKISNLNLVDGAQRTNQLFKMELRYRY